MNWLDPYAHPLKGLMDKKSEWQIRESLSRHRPSPEQLDALAAEELSGRDRPAVYRIFAEILK